MTAPTSRPSASFIGVERMRNARRAPSTAHGSTAAGALRTRPCARTRGTSATACAMRRSLRHAVDRLAERVGARAPNSRSAAGLMRVTRPLAVGDEHRVVERIDRRFGRLLRHQQLAEVRSPQLADPFGHPVEADGERADLVRRIGPARPRRDRRPPSASSPRSAGATGPTIALRQAELRRRRPPPSAPSASASVTKNQRRAMRDAASALRRIAS